MLEKVTTTIDPDLCTGCGLCIRVCPAGILSMVNGKAQVTGDQSLNCGHSVKRFAPKALLPSGPSTKPCPNMSHFGVIVIGLLTVNLTLVNLCDSWPPGDRVVISSTDLSTGLSSKIL